MSIGKIVYLTRDGKKPFLGHILPYGWTKKDWEKRRKNNDRNQNKNSSWYSSL